MVVIPLCIRYQQINFRIFSLTYLYIYYGLGICFGPYLGHHPPSVQT